MDDVAVERPIIQFSVDRMSLIIEASAHWSHRLGGKKEMDEWLNKQMHETSVNASVFAICYSNL